MDYNQIKKLDEESAQKLREGSGPSDKCICAILSPPEKTKKGFKESIKRAFASIGKGKKRGVIAGHNSIEIPLTYSKGGKGIYTTKEVVKRNSSCGKCGCDNENIVLKHSLANIQIVTPDISSICPCPSDCLPDKEKLKNNIKVTVERFSVPDVDSVDSEFNLYNHDDRQTISEPILTDEKRSITSLINDQYDDEDHRNGYK